MKDCEPFGHTGVVLAKESLMLKLVPDDKNYGFLGCVRKLPYCGCDRILYDS